MQTSGKPRLSVLIPIYNQKVQALATSLYQERNRLGLQEDIQLFFLDDGSQADTLATNRKTFAPFPEDYQEMGRNLGRSQIRWELANKAKADFLLFLDCDLALPQNFLEKWMEQVQKTNAFTIVTGGLRYAAQAPKQARLFLDWHYGKQREERPLEARKKKPHKAFMLSNSLIPKAIFQRFGKVQGFQGWGHEDTLFALRAFAEGVKFDAVDNPVLKQDLDNQALFMQKQIQAIDNLCNMGEKFDELKGLRLFQRAEQLSALPEFLLTKLVGSTAKRLITKPKLFTLDLWKLGLFALKLKQYKKK